MKEFIFTWRIENISYSWHTANEAIVSPSFTAGPMENSAWYLELYPRGDKNIADYFSLFLTRTDNGPDISLNFEFSCISAENAPLHSHAFQQGDKTFSGNGDGFGHPRFMTRHEVFARKALYLPQDVLTLRCRMWKPEGSVEEFGKSFACTRLRMDRILSVENVNPEMLEERTIYIHSKWQNKSLISIRILAKQHTIRVVIDPKQVKNIKYSVLRLLFMEKSNKKVLCEHTSTWLGLPKWEIWRVPLPFKKLKPGRNSIENNITLQSEFVYSTGEQTEHLEYDYSYPSRLSEIVPKYMISCISSGILSDWPGIFQTLWNLRVERILCDLELRTETSSFSAHQIVLCARSPVFLAMLTGDTKEKTTRCIEIEDIVDDILEKFLHFLYTDSFQDLEWGTAMGLYYAADKYQVERLRILCCCYLLKNANVDNVCELLMLADRHQDSDFKRRVENCILQHDEKVFSSSSWNQFVDEQPHVSAKTMLLRYDKERGEESDADNYEEILSRLPKVQDDFIVLYKDKTFSDLVMKTIGATFPVHKLMVCASSSKLRKMLIDNPTDIIEIQDLEDDTVSRMLVFLYTDSFEYIEWNTAMKLYHAADFYQIHRLKVKCSCFLLENIDTTNASDLLLLAHEHQDDRLKSVVVDYILLHDKEIFGSDAWADFSELNLRLANETMRLKYLTNVDS